MLKKLYVYFICIFIGLALVSSISALEADAGEYIDEFSVAGESCSISDAFLYTRSDDSIGLVSLYHCCTESNECILLPFDVYNRKVLANKDQIETFHITSIRGSISNKEIIPENYNPNSIDVCEYFGSKVDDESINLAFHAGDAAIDYAPKNYKTGYKIIKNTGSVAGVVNKFNIGMFVLAVSCAGLSKQEEEAFMKVGECYQLIKGIESGSAHYGISNEVILCNSIARHKLKIVLDSWFQVIKGGVNKVAATGKAFWNFGKDLMNNNANADINIGDTSYDQADNFYKRLLIEEKYYKNSNAEVLSLKSSARFQERLNDANLVYTRSYKKYHQTEDNIPGYIFGTIINIVTKPNHNYKSQRALLSDMESVVNLMKQDLMDNKYNSVIKREENFLYHLNQTQDSINQDFKVHRKADWIAIILLILGIFAFIILLVKFILNQKTNNSHFNHY